MMTHFLNWIKNFFRPKRQEMDPHEVMLHPKESDVPVYENEDAVKAEHCSSHNRFRKSCPRCQEIVA